MNNYWKHFKLILNHKKYVFQCCCKTGIPIQGLLHDMSKFSPTEFLESAKYYSGERSPIDNCKEANGYSMAWLHHRGRNKHHWEYWVDNFEKGMTAPLIPFKYVLEMLCDFIGAGKAYRKEKFSYADELKWWGNKRKTVIMHPVIKHFFDDMFLRLAAAETLTNNTLAAEKLLTKTVCKAVYETNKYFNEKDYKIIL